MDNSKKWKPFILVIIIIVLAFAIPMIIDCCIFGNDFPSHISNEAWAGFLGSFLGGIFTLLSVVYTIHDGDRKREEDIILREKEKSEAERKKHQVLIDTFFMNGTVESLKKNYHPDEIKYLFLCKDEKGPFDTQEVTILQLINRFSYPVTAITIAIETVNPDGQKHEYVSEVPYLYPQDYTFVVLPHMIDAQNSKGNITTPNNEMVELIEIEYTSLSNERIKLQVKELIDYTYTSNNEELFHYRNDVKGKILLPDAKKL